MAELIEMPLGMDSDGTSGRGMGNLGGICWPIVKYGEYPV